jgi:ribosomal protein S18 acetylase RimI-like enzyme
MSVRPFRREDAPALAALSSECARSESEFVLNPLWESEGELFAEFARHGVDPAEHVLVAEGGLHGVVGLSGFVRRPEAQVAGLLCPIVEARERGHGHGGELLRATLDLGARALGIRLVVAGIGTRNRAGYALLTGQGFRPVRQNFLMRCDARPAAAAPPVGGLAFDVATPDDAAGILAIYEKCGFEPRTPDGMRAVLADGRHGHAVAREGPRVVAFSELETHWPRRAWVAYVGVSPELRAKGLGSALTAFTLHRQWEQGARTALLVLSPANRTAYRAYEKVGFRRHRTFDVLERALS